MGAEWLAQCNDALDSPFAAESRRPAGGSPGPTWGSGFPDYEGCSQLIAPAPGTRGTEERIGSTWTLPAPFSDGFRRMIDNPTVNARLAWMIDPGFNMTTCYTIVSRDGACGQNLHGGWFYGSGHNYQYRDGQPRSEQVNIGWLLQDVETAAGDGGLMLVPGSHKARLPLPRPRQTSCDMPQVNALGLYPIVVFEKAATESVRKYGIKWLSCITK
jgi:hypothetical protein